MKKLTDILKAKYDDILFPKKPREMYGRLEEGCIVSTIFLKKTNLQFSGTTIFNDLDIREDKQKNKGYLMKYETEHLRKIIYIYSLIE